MEYPILECSNPYIENFFRYRLDTIRLLAFEPHGTVLQYPGIYEGFGPYHRHISYSAAAHMREARWFSSPALAQGSILNFIANQNEDGSFPSHLDPDVAYRGGLYHTDWGSAILELHSVHADTEFLVRIYPSLVRYATYFLKERDPEQCFLYDVFNHFETGQECNPRYTAVDPAAWNPQWGRMFRLKGVDATTYVYTLFDALAKIARILMRHDEGVMWERRAQRVKDAIRSYMWDVEEAIFFDVDPATMRRTRVKALTCFYPYMTDVALRHHLASINRHLLNRREFWTPYPFATLSIKDPHFSAEGIWNGTRVPCPWNGRVWPMTNSHMAEVIARSAIRFQSALRHTFVRFFTKWMTMMCFQQDPSRPNSFEHYHPFTGAPSTKESGFLGLNHYLHSWINDIIIKYVAGIRPQWDGLLLVDPFPFNCTLRIRNLLIRGHDVDVEIMRNRYSVRVDQRRVESASIGAPVRIILEN